MGSLSGTEILVILALALLLFGPRRLPQIGKSLGRGLSELRKASYDFRSSLEREVEVEKLKETSDELRSVGREIVDAAKDVRTSTPDAPDRKS
jgi:TatA/E family protein of Tat protein translocase